MISYQLYIQCLIAGLLGILIHVFGIKLPALKKRSDVANKKFSIQDYLADDWIGIGLSVITVLVAILLLDEIIGYKPALLKYIKYFFVFIGYTGSSLLLSALSKTDKAINAVVDKKTNIADNADNAEK